LRGCGPSQSAHFTTHYTQLTEKQKKKMRGLEKSRLLRFFIGVKGVEAKLCITSRFQTCPNQKGISSSICLGPL
jgi:hypothetical protein